MQREFRGAIFDVDGVLVDSPHEAAWREALRELMGSSWSDIREQSTWSPERFTPQVYRQVMSGKSRMSGARAAPRLVVADGAPGLISTVEEIWPRADRQHCAVHRLRNLQAKLPKSEHNRIRFKLLVRAHRRDVS